jgi:spoIIIJ-associated protein
VADYIEKEGPSAEEAVFSALHALGISEQEAQIQVLAVAKTGRAKVRVAKKGVELPPVDANPEIVSGLEHPVYQKPEAYASGGRRTREVRYASDEEIGKMESVLNQMTQMMGLSMVIERKVSPESTVLNLKGEREGLLIGKKGANLQALQLFVTEVINRDLRHEKIQMHVDVGSYREKLEEKLMQEAVAFADQAIAEARQVATLPLTAADRRVMHMALKERTDVETFSVGDGEYKRVVIQKKS